MSGPYDQEKYERAKATLADPTLPEASRKIRTERVRQYEDDRARGYLPAPAAKGEAPLMAEAKSAEENTANALGGMNSWLDSSKSETAEVVRNAMPPEQLAARRAAVDWGKNLARDEKLQTASKLKVFNDPPEYSPPKLRGSALSGLAALKPTVRYFEPTVGEFRQAAEADPRLMVRLREQNPDIADLGKLPDDKLENSNAYKVFSDARWQHALGDAMKSRTPIKRVAFTDSDWMGGGQATNETGAVIPGDRKPSVADLMDGASAAATGALQGASFGGYDAALTALGADEMRDQGRGSVDRHPVLGIAGELYGGLSKRGGPSRLVRGLSTIGRPTSLAGRAAKAGAVGATTAVVDQNLRAVAKLAADAMDAQDSAGEALARIQEGLPGFQPKTIALGAGAGAGADILGAGAGRLANAAPKALGVRDPMQVLEARGGQLNVVGGPKLSLRSQAYANRASKLGTNAPDMIAESSVQPMARQAMLEQEAAKRAAELETNIAQAGLGERTLPTSDAVAAIKAEAHGVKPITPLAKAQQRQLLDLANEVASSPNVSAAQLDDFIEQVDDMARKGRSVNDPVEHLNNASRHLRSLRDKLGSADDELTVADRQVEDRGLFTAEPDATLIEQRPDRLAGIRDAHGNVTPVKGYSELKARQYRDKTLQESANARLLGGGGVKPQTLTAEPVFAEHTDKGLFNTSTPEEVVSSIKPKVKLNLGQHEAIKGNIRNLARPDNLAAADELKGLASRVGPGMERKIQVIQEMDAANDLAASLGRAIDGVSARGGNVSAFLDRKQLFRFVPTLSNLAGGLPKRVASDKTVSRLKEFLSSRIIGAGKPVPGNPIEVMPRPSKATLASHEAEIVKASGSITEDEARAVHRFTHGYDQSIRDMQRGATDAEVAARHPRGMEHAAEARASIPNLMSYMSKMPPAKEVPYIYRGITVTPEQAKKMLSESIITADPSKVAVTSASADPVVARSFVARNIEPGKTGIVLKLKHRTAVGTKPFASDQMKVEKELLLRGDAKFRVVKRYEDTSNPGQYIIEAEEVPNVAEELGKMAGRVPAASRAARKGFAEGFKRKDKQTTFIPQLPSMNMRAGLPARVIGAAQDEPDDTAAEFSQEEADFWMKVIDNLGKESKK